MEQLIKMKIVPLSIEQDDIDEVVKKIINLFKLGYVDENLNIRVGQGLMENTNILDYFTGNSNLPRFKEIQSKIKDEKIIKEELFTTVSPIKLRQSKINKTQKWIK